jgi:hypothetical protein
LVNIVYRRGGFRKNPGTAHSFLKFLLLSEKEYTKIETNKSGKLCKNLVKFGRFSAVLTMVFHRIWGKDKVYKLYR